jgi:transposase InsO family protein
MKPAQVAEFIRNTGEGKLYLYVLWNLSTTSPQLGHGLYLRRFPPNKDSVDCDGGAFHRIATAIDLYSRRLLGYAMGAHHDADLVVAALNMAAATRGGDVSGVIFHSNRSSEYTSKRFGDVCRHWGVWQSTGHVGSCFDNAVSEAFNSVLKVEYLHRHRFATRSEARLKIATWITDFYNTRRMHSVCDFVSPMEFEQRYWAQQVWQQAA